MEAPAGHPQAMTIVKIVHVQAETAISSQGHQSLQNLVEIDRPAIRGKSHQLVFATIDLETAVVREGRIQQAQRVWKRQMAVDVKLMAVAAANRGRAPFTDSVNGQNRGPFKRAGKERTGRVAFMMIRKYEACFGCIGDPRLQHPAMK